VYEHDQWQAIDQLARTWWVRLPLAIRRVSRGIALTLVDGLYLAARPRVGGAAPPVAFLVGLVTGWLRLGFEQAFSESIIVLVLAVVFGVMSAHLGAMFLVGFALGDFLLAPPSYSMFTYSPLGNLVLIRIPLLIEYGLLALLTVSIPLVTKGLLFQLSLSPRLSRQLRFRVAVVGHAILTGVLIYFWTQTVPILIRPVYTWQGSEPTVEAIAPLQQGGWVLVLVAVLVSLSRMVLQGQTVSRPELGARMDAMEQRLASAPPLVPLWQRVPLWGRVAAQALVASLLLSGMMQSWFDALLLGGLLFLIQAARSRLIAVPLGPWPALVERVPLLLRLVGGFALIFALSLLILRQQVVVASDSFRPIVLLTCVALVVMYLLAPGLPMESDRAERAA
jgi:hypothetical protein